MRTTTMKRAIREGKNRVYNPIFVQGISNDNIPIETLKENQKQLMEKCDRLVFTIENLSSMEESERPKLEKQLLNVELMLAALKPRRHKYPIFSQIPLTWRDKKGYPKLVLMALDGEGFVEIKAQNDTYNEGKAVPRYNPLREDRRFKDIYEKVIGWCYGDVGALLCDKCPTHGEVSIRTELSGLLIPEKTREKIAVAKLYFGDQLFMITEVKEWVENETVYPDPDPMIVGYEDGHLFLVDTFDLTTVEKIAACEFVVPQSS